MSKKTLVIYFSAEGHTKRVSEIIAKTLDADLYEITPKKPYTKDDLDWMNSESRCTKEHDGVLSRDIELKDTEIPKWEEYDKVFIGYPIWWAIAAWPVTSFTFGRDFKGKTVIPFCTSHSSGLGDSDLKVKHSTAQSGDWRKGMRFFQDVREDDVVKWVKSLKKN